MKIVFTVLFIGGCVAFIVYNVICIVKKVKERKSSDKAANEKCKKENDETIRKE